MLAGAILEIGLYPVFHPFYLIRADFMLHVGGVLQHSGALCCTWTYSRVLCCTCSPSRNIRGYYVARASSLATFEGTMLHVHLLLQHSGVLCCTCSSSCNIRECYVARGPRLATFEGAMLHVLLVLQLYTIFTKTKN